MATQNQNQNSYPQNNYPANNQGNVGYGYQNNQPPVYHSPNADFNSNNFNNTTLGSNNQRPGGPKKKFNLQEFLVKKWWAVLLGLLLFLALVVGVFAFVVSQSGGDEVPVIVYDDVAVNIIAPSTLPQGSPGDWEVKIENFEEVALTNIILELDFDEDFQYVEEINPRPDNLEGNIYSVPRIDPVTGRSPASTIRFRGLLNGNIDIETVMNGKLSYIPQFADGTTGELVELEIKDTITKITSPDIEITLQPTTDEIQNGGQVELTVIVENTSDQEIRDLRLRMDYPGNEETFTYLSSQYFRTTNSAPVTEPSDGDDIWEITRLPAGSRQTWSIIGSVFGGNDSKLTFGAEVGIKTQNNDYQTIWQGFKDVTVIAQPLLVQTEVLGKDSFRLFEPGENLTIEVSYKNQSQRTLSNVEIFSFIEDSADLLDLSSIQFSGGERGDVTGSELVWRAPRVPGLATLLPNQEGSFKYTVDVVGEENFYNTNLDQQQYVLTPGVRGKASDLEDIATTGSKYRARGQLNFELPDVERLGINPTTNRQKYKVTWKITNAQNEITEARVRAILPIVGAWNDDSVEPSSARSGISYNEQTGEIIWDLGKIESYTGTVRLPLEVSFEIEAENTDRELLTDIAATGTDIFTGEKYEQKKANLRAN
jgi:hypothetical protein